jgi:sialic acid synthase SpsE
MSFVVAGRRVGEGHPLFVIAEIGLNHGGDPERALALVDAAAASGASAVKLQTLDATLLVAPSCPAPMHVQASSLADFFGRFELDEDAHRRVASRAHSLGLAFISTPFYEDAVGLLCDAGCDALKIASGDITHFRLIEIAARSGRPLILSTGMSALDEIRSAIQCAREAGARDLAVLHCVSAYPTPSASANLGAIATLARALEVPVGLSDHGTDPLAAALTVALGGAIYERHFVERFDADAVDRAVSSSPEELADSIRLAGRAALLLGDGIKHCLDAERGNLEASRRGVYAARDLACGDALDGRDLVMLRPAAGISAHRWRDVVGRRLRADVPAGAPIPPAALDPPFES